MEKLKSTNNSGRINKRILYLALEIDLNDPNWETYALTSTKMLFQDWLDTVRVDVEGARLSLYSEVKD